AELDDDRVCGVDEHVRQRVVVEERLQDAEAEDARREIVELTIRELGARGLTDALTQRAPSRRITVRGEHRARVETCGDLGANASEHIVRCHSARMRSSTA